MWIVSFLKVLSRSSTMQEGVPESLHDAYTRESMLRADGDQDGMLSMAEVGFQRSMGLTFLNCCLSDKGERLSWVGSHSNNGNSLSAKLNWAKKSAAQQATMASMVCSTLVFRT